MNNIRVSIIIPAYNEERYLARCLDAVALQSTKAHEVILVDNNSTDATAKIARKYSFVTVVHEQRQGRVYAQNTGFNLATGDIVARIDVDTILPADWTESIARYFDTPGSLETAWTGTARFYNVRLPRITSLLYGWVAFGYNRILTGQPSLWGSSMAFPRSMWRQVGPGVCMRSDLHEDLDLSLHIREAGYRIFHDRHTHVGVELRPAYAGPGQVWEYLSMWPRTLRLHSKIAWLFCWPVNCCIFAGMPFFGLSERLARLAGRKSLSD